MGDKLHWTILTTGLGFAVLGDWWLFSVFMGLAFLNLVLIFSALREERP